MLYRSLVSDIQVDIKNNPVIIILGPRQVGKSTLVQKILKIEKPHIYLDLELPSDESKLDDPELFLKSQASKLVIIDEVQRMPKLFPLIRALVDQSTENGRFILLGSSSESLILKSSESLAGRSVYFELHPLHLVEVGNEHMEKLWLHGGFPRAFLAKTSTEAGHWLNQFIKTYIERELNVVYLKASPIQLERFLQMISTVHGQLCNYSMIAGSMDLSVPTVKRYIEFFESCYLLRTLNPYFTNSVKRLVKSPKVYIRDSGILHVLRGIDSMDSLHGDIIKGHSWEGFVIQQIISQLALNVKPYFYRTSNGAELDLLLVKGGKVIVGFEIKYSNSPKLSQSIHEIVSDLKIPQILVITPSSDEYQMHINILVTPLSRLRFHLKRLNLISIHQQD